MLRNFIDGRSVEATSELSADLIDPCTEEVYEASPLSRDADVDAAMKAAYGGFQTWRRTTPSERQDALLRLATLVEDRAGAFSEADLRNTGSTAAAHEVGLMVDQLRFYAGAARMLEGRSAGEYVSDHTSYVRRESLGVCVGIAPWNFPLLMAVLKLAPAVAAGNSVVLKPALTTPSSTLLLAELSQDILPAGVVNVVCGDDVTGQLLVAHPEPASVALTGSIDAGIEVARTAASSLKRVHLELGGKTPVVVTANADLDAAASGIVTGALTNAGQDCTAASRVLADSSVHDELLARLRDLMQAARPGPPDDDAATYGPLNNAAQLERLGALIDSLPAHTRIECGGHRSGDRGYFFEPTLVSGVLDTDPISSEEIFGPAVTVQSFESLPEAITSANRVRQGLAASIWTESDREALRLTQELDSGCVWVNTVLGFPTEMPHGGFKYSGYGKDLSVYSMDEYTRVKHVMHHL